MHLDVTAYQVIYYEQPSQVYLSDISIYVQ